jgi:hypothetical protein
MSAAAVVVGIDAAAGAPPPYQTDDSEPVDPTGEDESEEPADPPEGDEAPPEEGSEPSPEPGDVPVYVWVGAGVLVLVAIIWGVSVAASD